MSNSVDIRLEQVYKRFKRDWIIKDLTRTISSGSKLAILGINGSGKSTLLKMISGFVGKTAGKISWDLSNNALEITTWHNHFAYCAPYLELVDSYTLKETIDFHFKLKRQRADVELSDWLQETGLSEHMDKPINLFSSGMQQRTKLILCLATDVPVYLLDEPCSNLDESGINWYQKKLSGLSNDKTVIIASNQPYEYPGFTDEINTSNYK